MPARGFPREGILLGNIDGGRRSREARGSQDSRVMAGVLTVSPSDGGGRSRADSITPQAQFSRVVGYTSDVQILVD
jgi:hypothetical protein